MKGARTEASPKLPDRSLERLQHDVDAGLDLRVFILEFRHGLLGAEQHHAAAWDDPFLDCRAGGMEGIFNPVLLPFTSTSVEPPTRITATPPASFARRSWSFSLS